MHERRKLPLLALVFPVPAENRTLYVGNLPYDATADEVEQLLTKCAVTTVLRVHLPPVASSLRSLPAAGGYKSHQPTVGYQDGYSQ